MKQYTSGLQRRRTSSSHAQNPSANQSKQYSEGRRFKNGEQASRTAQKQVFYFYLFYGVFLVDELR